MLILWIGVMINNIVFAKCTVVVVRIVVSAVRRFPSLIDKTEVPTTLLPATTVEGRNCVRDCA